MACAVPILKVGWKPACLENQHPKSRLLPGLERQTCALVGGRQRLQSPGSLLTCTYIAFVLFLLLSLLVERSASKLQVLFADGKGILDTVTRGEFVFFFFF